MLSVTTITRLVLLIVILGAGVAVARYEPTPADEDLYRPVNSRDGLAIHGFDPVAYIEDHEAVRGSAEYTVRWEGAEWRFASESNRKQFLSNPSAYAPQYGGFEAYGVALGKAYDIDPYVFDVVDGRVYLHRNERVRELWQRNPDGYIAEADDAWRLRAKLANP